MFNILLTNSKAVNNFTCIATKYKHKQSRNTILSRTDELQELHTLVNFIMHFESTKDLNQRS